MQMTARRRLLELWRSHLRLLVILGVAAGSRVALVARNDVEPHIYRVDELWYRFHGAAIATGQGLVNQWGLPNASFPPGYPLLLAPLHLVFRSETWTYQALNVVLSTLTCLFVYLFARRAYGPSVAWVAAALLALCPGDIFYAGVAFSELPFQCAFIASLLAFLVWNQALQEPSGTRWVAYGALLGIASLVRGASLPFLPVAIVARWISSGSWRAALRMAFFSALGFTALVGPWFLRNALVIDAPLLFASNGSNALIIAHSPIATGRGKFRGVGRLKKELFSYLDDIPYPQREGELAKAETRYAIRWALTHPLQEMALIPSRLYWLYSGDHVFVHAYKKAYRDVPATEPPRRLVPNTRWYNMWVWIADLYFSVVLLLALAGFTRTLSRAAATTAIVPLTFLYFNFLHGVVFFGDPRFHAAFLPLLMILAAVGIDGRKRPWPVRERAALRPREADGRFEGEGEPVRSVQR